MGFLSNSGLTITYTELGRQYLSNSIPAKKTIEFDEVVTTEKNRSLNESNFKYAILKNVEGVEEFDTVEIGGQLYYLLDNQNRFLLNVNEPLGTTVELKAGSVVRFEFTINYIHHDDEIEEFPYQIVDENGVVYVDDTIKEVLINKTISNEFKINNDNINSLYFSYIGDREEEVEYDINDVETLDAVDFTFNYDFIIVSEDNTITRIKTVNGLVIDYFSLGDSDINYFDGYEDNMISDVVSNSGESDKCINGNRVKSIKHNLIKD